jgi:Zn-dependent M28 family amino/carboxypeptidase
MRPGTVREDELVIVMAHRDCGAPPGANDDGSGTATMLAIADAVRGIPTERSLVFLSSAGEEGVAEGTVRFIEQLGPDRLTQIRAVISMDMFGVGGRLNLVDRAHWPDREEPLQHTPWLVEALEAAAARRGYHVGRMDADWGAAESGRFLEHGVPAAWFWKADDPAYHSPFDSPERIDGNMLKVVGEITADVALDVANGRIGP